MKALYILLTFCGLLLSSSCEKFLDPRPTIATISTLADCQSLIEYENAMSGLDAYSNEVSSDNFFLKDADYQALTPDEFKRMYTWAGKNLFYESNNDWFNCYKGVNIANVVLDALQKIPETPDNSVEYRNVKGQAIFLRAKLFANAAATWAQAYDPANAGKQPGIPLRETADFNAKSTRATLQETYDEILSELEEAATLLPDVPFHLIRSSKPAAFAMLARVSLAMRRYEQAGEYADKCLKMTSTLIDYNTVKFAATGYSFTPYNVEVIHHYKMQNTSLLGTLSRVDPALYQSYSTDDLRKALFFQQNADGYYTFRGSYWGSVTMFTGVTTGEMYLVKAESLARKGDISGAMKWLGDLQVKRYKTGKYVTPTASTVQQALALVLTERRKEMIFRGQRWSDIKRLNLEGANISLTRTVAGQTYILPANDNRFALPIPEDVIQKTGMAQNP